MIIGKKDFIRTNVENLLLREMVDEYGARIEKAPHAQMTVGIPWNEPLEPMTIVRRKCHGM